VTLQLFDQSLVFV